jgi:tetratricopeptide (TPR) repeat protein
MVDYYAVLQLPRDADAAAIVEAYTRLSKAYDPTTLVGVSDELRTLVQQRRLELDQAHAILSDATLRAAYDAGLSQVIDRALPTVAEPQYDYAPLPPALARERVRDFETEPVQHTPVAPDPRTRQLPFIFALAFPLLIVLVAFVLTDGGTKVAPKNDTPPVESINSQLDQFEAAIATARLATDADPQNLAAWIEYGNMLYNSVQIVRELQPNSVTYTDRINRWQMAAVAYEKAMELAPDNVVVAADHGAALCFYGNGIGDKKSSNAGLQQIRSVRDRIPATDQSRVLMNLAYCLVENTPPQVEEAKKVWQTVIDSEAKDSPIALQAAKLIAQFR